MDIQAGSEASRENVKSLGQFLSNNCEFACALTQSIEPIVTDGIIIKTHFLGQADTGIHDIFSFLSTHQAQEETENYIAVTSQMQNFTEDDGQDTHL